MMADKKKDNFSDFTGKELGGCLLLEKVGEGGMGAVFKAKHKALNRIVCLKVLNPALSKDEKAIDFFLKEARAIAELDDPNIVHVYDVGTQDGYHYIIMSYIDGANLSSIVKKKKELPIEFVVDIFRGVFKGLAAARAKGIIHRDIKPSNILVNKNLEAKIVDFGIAKKVDKDGKTTKTKEIAGTAYFISPEQALGKEIDARTDLYAVGASLYFALTGKYPYRGKTSIEIIQKHITEPVPDPSKERKDIPMWLAKAVMRLMAKKPQDRFQSASECVEYFTKGIEEESYRRYKSDDKIDIKQSVGLKVSNVVEYEKDDGDIEEEFTQRYKRKVDTKTPKPKTPSKPKHFIPMAEEELGEKRKELKKIKSITQSTKINRVVGKSTKTGLIGNISSRYILQNILYFVGFIVVGLIVAGYFSTLGNICSGYIKESMNFFDMLFIPVSNKFISEQLIFAILAIPAIFLILGVGIVEKLSASRFFLFLIAFFAYLSGLFNVAGTSIGLINSNYYLMYALVSFIVIFWFSGKRSTGMFNDALLFLALCLFMFSIYKGTYIGEYTGNQFAMILKYVSILAGIASFYMVYARKNFLMVMLPLGALVLFAFSVWAYNASPMAYKSLNEINSYKKYLSDRYENTTLSLQARLDMIDEDENKLYDDEKEQNKLEITNAIGVDKKKIYLANPQKSWMTISTSAFEYPIKNMHKKMSESGAYYFGLVFLFLVSSLIVFYGLWKEED